MSHGYVSHDFRTLTHLANDRAKEAAKQAKIDAKKAKEEAKEAEVARLEAEKAAAETAKAAVEAEQKNTAKMSAEVNGPGRQFRRCQC